MSVSHVSQHSATTRRNERLKGSNEWQTATSEYVLDGQTKERRWALECEEVSRRDKVHLD